MPTAAAEMLDRIQRRDPPAHPGADAAVDRADPPKPVRLLVVEPHELVREALMAVLSRVADLDVVAAVGTRADGVLAASSLHPDVAILEIRLPDGHGAELCHELRAAAPRTRCIILSAHDSPLEIALAHKTGATAYLCKGIGVDDLIAAIRDAAHGEPLTIPHSRAVNAALSSMTTRELQVLRFVAAGLTDRKIADQLCLPAGAERGTISTLMRRLNMTNRAQVAVFASHLLA